MSTHLNSYRHRGYYCDLKMSEFVPTKRHLREILLYHFISKKTAAQSHRILVKTYGKYAPSESSCRERFRRFKCGDFDTEDKERSGRPAKFEDEELKILLEEDPNQTHEELAQSLNVTRSTVSRHLKAKRKKS